ncbi:sulfotransferase [Microbulbifer sp. Q7]|uniref:tetratricopeptide repeat-containing sulfotransferase family protein n=1 Tax=Microbulbifer sp. Q7 TaxID=1785091 RepID=UPI000829B434|nr:sulfotransferase [Microbulbifer sp. Q7]
MKNLYLEKITAARKAFASGDKARAEQLLLDCAGAHGNPIPVLIELVQLYRALKQPEKSIPILKELARIDRTDLSHLSELAHTFQALGRNAEAAQTYRQVVSQRSDLPNTWFNLAWNLTRAGELQEAIAAYERAISCGIGGKDEVYLNIAGIHATLKNFLESKKCLDKALDVNPRYIPALFNLGSYYEEQGLREEAEKLYQQCLREDPGFHPALCRLSHMSRGGDNSELLMEKIRRLLATELPESAREELLFAEGKLLDECGRYAEAWRSFGSANLLGKKRVPPFDVENLKGRIREIISFKKEYTPCLPQAESTPSSLFICGMFRSGSTLLEQIIGGHSEIVSGGELYYFSDAFKRRGAAYPEFYDWATGCGGLASGYLSFVQKRFGAGNIGMLTDKSPENFMYVGLIKALFPKSKFIWTRRNFEDNRLSIFFQHLGEALNYSVDLQWIRQYYEQQQLLMEYWCSKFPDSIYEIHYERLIESPREEIEGLFGFLGLPWEDACLNFRGRKNHVQTASIWQVREDLHSRSVGRFKNYRPFLSE